MRILFMGTPDFAVPSLEALIAAGHTVCGVFTQPDKPRNRGMKLQAPPVKVCALAHSIPVYQPVKLRDGAALALIQELAPELIVVAAYGRILPDEILAAPPKGCINVHSSLLPNYRGAAPIHWAVLNGDRETGVTIMHMAHDLDAGDIIAQAAPPIAAGTATRTPQEHGKATRAPMLSRELSPMDWSRPARALHNQVRGLIPWPTAVTELGGNRCKVFSTSVLDATTSAAPGTILAAGKEGIQVACGGGTVLRIDELQADGGKRMKAADDLRGHPIPVG